MFKKLCLVLAIVLAVAVGGAWGAESSWDGNAKEGQECRVPAQSKIFMMVNAQDSLPVMPNIDIRVTLGEQITPGLVEFFTAESERYGVPMDWTGARVATVSDGKLIVVREVDLRDCE